MSKLSPGTLLLAIMAVLFGLLGAYVVKQQMNTPVKPLAQIEPEKAIIVPRASANLSKGRKVTMGDVALMQMTLSQRKEAGLSGTFMTNPSQIIGRVLNVDLGQGETFDSTTFYPEGTGPDISEMLENGQRAVTVPVEVDAAVAGFARPGTWVDVLFRADENEEIDLPETTVTLLERVRVLALNNETFAGANSDEKEASVTLAIDASEATRLPVVAGRGTLSLVLRNQDDDSLLSSLAPKTLDEILDLPPTRRHRIEVYRGRQLSSVDFRRDARQTPPVFALAQDDATGQRVERKGDVVRQDDQQPVTAPIAPVEPQPHIRYTRQPNGFTPPIGYQRPR